MTHTDNSIDQLKQAIQKQNTEILRSIDTSKVKFDNDYYTKRYRIVRQYNSLYVKHKEPLGLKTVSFILIILIGTVVIALPILPFVFFLAIEIRKEEQKIKSNQNIYKNLNNQ